VILFVDLKLNSVKIHAEKQNPVSRYRVMVFFICHKFLQIKGLTSLILTKLRFENQKAAKSKKQACHSLMYQDYLRYS